MCCRSLDELIPLIISRLGIRSRNRFADLIGVHSDTLSNWRNNENVITHPRSASAFNDFRIFANNPKEFINTRKNNEDARRLQTSLTDDINEDIKQHYQDWKGHFDENQLSTPAQSSQDSSPVHKSYPQRPLPVYQSTVHFRNTAIFAKLIRWKDKENSECPFETKTVGMRDYKTEVDIYDEAVLYRHDTIESTPAGHLR